MSVFTVHSTHDVTGDFATKISRPVTFTVSTIKTR